MIGTPGVPEYICFSSCSLVHMQLISIVHILFGNLIILFPLPLMGNCSSQPDVTMSVHVWDRMEERERERGQTIVFPLWFFRHIFPFICYSNRPLTFLYIRCERNRATQVCWSCLLSDLAYIIFVIELGRQMLRWNDGLPTYQNVRGW